MEIRIDPMAIRRIRVDTQTCETITELLKALREQIGHTDTADVANIMFAIRDAYNSDNHTSYEFDSCIDGSRFQVIWDESLY